MKNRFLYIIIIITTFVALSCNDFLELTPESQGVAVTNTSADSVFFHSANEVEAALGAAYGDFKNEYYQLDYFVNGDAQSDDAYAGGDNPANFQIDDYTIDATNSNVSRDWRYLYSTIGKTNTILNNIDDLSTGQITDQRKKEIIGEASFIRAFMYFQCVQLWGDVPLQLKEVKAISAEKLDEIYPVLFPARNPKEDVYEKIISDLETALVNVKTTAEHKGIVTRGAVNTMLAKVYATITPVNWEKVGKYCDDVIAGGYSLMPNYNDLWNNSAENTAESIFEINYSGGASDGNWGVKIFRGLDWKKFNLPSNDLVGAFDEQNDQIRKSASIIFLDVTGKWSDSRWPQTKYPFINKYRKFTEGSDQNYIFFRLADVLLLKAEVLNARGDIAGALALVNQIRSRVALPSVSATTADAVATLIAKERRLELAFEGHRWWDLKRTGKAIEVINSAKGPNGTLYGYHLTENRLLWPIPQSELDKNQKLTQNPGY